MVKDHATRGSQGGSNILDALEVFDISVIRFFQSCTIFRCYLSTWSILSAVRRVRLCNCRCSRSCRTIRSAFDTCTGCILEKRVTELSLEEFLCYGPQREAGKEGKSLARKAKDGRIYSWKVEQDDSHCTLQEAFEKVDQSLGFNIELKFDDNINYQDEDLVHIIQVILQVVFEHAKDRPIIFSSFQPDAARLVRKLQTIYPVFFLTNGGSEVYVDVRRNSLDEAMKLCLANGLQGIVSEVRAIFRNLGAIPRIKEANLSLLTYGQLNNVPEAVYMQHLMGVEGVIVDLAKEIAGAVFDFVKPVKEEELDYLDGLKEELQMQQNTQPIFSQRKLSYLLKLIPELIKV
ncbi:Glycerophosphoryl diester phosphodiesterase [Cinnamomum micranthum f. kanehirae]|uniref:glycerophosphodiester phosphodiesterase n=1 Tax=Cinnamomum micranthum f. kanehirae TaxID=337451 RepID=A0A443N7G5_9MAGN|nr:Glycerophosphoryl diester phosphodiesterase [Cinnamomum micranthum f. kanehirae]